jgi:hypothetical protein
MLALLSPFLGILGSLLPSIVRIFERKQEIQYELKLTQIKLEAAERQADLQYHVEEIKADAELRQSALDHDKSLDGGKFINSLRASIRPVITYSFFILFVAVKWAAAYTMIANGQDIPTMLDAVWDPDTMSLFSTIIAFWFGSRVMEKQEKIAAVTASQQPQIAIKIGRAIPVQNKKPAGTGRDK